MLVLIYETPSLIDDIQIALGHGLKSKQPAADNPKIVVKFLRTTRRSTPISTTSSLSSSTLINPTSTKFGVFVTATYCLLRPITLFNCAYQMIGILTQNMIYCISSNKFLKFLVLWSTLYSTEQVPRQCYYIPFSTSQTKSTDKKPFILFRRP